MRLAPEDCGEAWTFKGYHATTCAGAMGIIKDRRIKKMAFAGIYCMLVQQPKSPGCLHDAQKLVFDGKRDCSNVVFEISCKGSSMSLKSGGIPADAEVVEQGYIAHMKTSSENRWCVPEHIVNLEAVWICHSSFAFVSGLDFFESVC